MEKSIIPIGVGIFGVFIVIAFIVGFFDVYKIPTHFTQGKLIGAQYIPPRRSVNTNPIGTISNSSYVPAQYVGRFLVDGKEFNLCVDRKSYEKFKKMSSANGSLMFDIRYQRTHYTKSAIRMRPILNSNEQFVKME